MENKHLFFPSPAAQEGFSGCSCSGPARHGPGAALGVLQQPQSPCCLIPLCLALGAPLAAGLCACSTEPFLKANPQFAVAQPQRKPNSSFLPSILPEL